MAPTLVHRTGSYTFWCALNYANITKSIKRIIISPNVSNLLTLMRQANSLDGADAQVTQLRKINFHLLTLCQANSLNGADAQVTHFPKINTKSAEKRLMKVDRSKNGRA